MLFVPMSAHVKAVFDAESETLPQLSEDPLSISAESIEAFPVASSCTVMSWHIATGSILSSTVTMATQVSVCPLPSSTVSVMLFVPMSAHVKAVCDAERLTVPQLSEDPLSISDGRMEAFPVASSCTVMSWHSATGSILSSTVTVATQVSVCPLPSSTVSVMLLVPMSAQVKAVCDAERLTVPQLSEDPLSMSDGRMEAFPVASSCTVMSWHIATGSILSSTVTVATQVSVCPFPSSTVSVILFVPMSVHVKAVCDAERLTVPQLSDDPLSMSDGRMEAFPVASSCTVMFWHTAFGSILSSTVTVATQVSACPFPSSTVSVTLFVPMSVHVKAVCDAERLTVPQLSDDPLSMSDGRMETFPVASSCTVMSWHIATGSILSSTVTMATQVSVCPLPSSTVSVMLFVPMSAHVKAVCDAERLTVPQLSEDPLSISAGSIEAFPVASSCTVMSWHRATGSILSSTVMIAVHVSVCPKESSTVKFTGIAVPISVQSKVLTSIDNIGVSKSSVEPLSISAAVIVALPDTSS